MVIGFERVVYTTNESDPQVIVAVAVLEGELGRSVELKMLTMDGTALSECRTNTYIELTSEKGRKKKEHFFYCSLTVR